MRVCALQCGAITSQTTPQRREHCLSLRSVSCCLSYYGCATIVLPALHLSDISHVAQINARHGVWTISSRLMGLLLILHAENEVHDGTQATSRGSLSPVAQERSLRIPSMLCIYGGKPLVAQRFVNLKVDGQMRHFHSASRAAVSPGTYLVISGLSTRCSAATHATYDQPLRSTAMVHVQMWCYPLGWINRGG